MTDQLQAVLNRYADDMAEGHQVPATPAVSQVRRTDRPWLRRIAVPTVAAASVAAVAVGAAVLRTHESAPSVVSVAATDSPQQVQPGDTSPPPPVLGPEDPQPLPVTPPPPERSGLTTALELPASAVVEKLTTYTAVLTNPTEREVPMRPCPDYRMEFGGQGTIGRLPCDKLPATLAAGQTLRIDLAAVFGYWDGPDTTDRDAEVSWAIAGPTAARGRLTLKPVPLGAPVAIASFLNAPAPPGEPISGQEGLQRGMRPEWGLTPTIISAPQDVRAGETLHFTVRLVNVNPKEPVQLSPCRGFTEWLQRPVQPPGQQVAFLDWSFERHEISSLQSEEHMLNCGALPKELPARRWVQLEMELRVPADYPPGPTSLAWKVGELDVFGSMQSRYVTINVSR